MPRHNNLELQFLSCGNRVLQLMQKVLPSTAALEKSFDLDLSIFLSKHSHRCRTTPQSEVDVCAFTSLTAFTPFSLFYSRSFRSRPEARESQNSCGYAIFAHEDPRVQSPLRDDRRGETHRDHRSRTLRYVRLHQEQDGALHAEGQAEPKLCHLHGNGEYS